jgi:GNAT superfamily N-acetyltransferase
VKTWQHAYKGQLPNAYLNSLSIEKRTARWEKNLSDPNSKMTTYVALIDSKIVGFCNVGPNRDDDISSDTGELYAIYIDPRSQGKRVGTQLMERGLDTLRLAGYNKATLWVLTSNEKTRKFYEHKGWRLEGKTKTESKKNVELHETRYIIDL